MQPRIKKRADLPVPTSAFACDVDTEWYDNPDRMNIIRRLTNVPDLMRQEKLSPLSIIHDLYVNTSGHAAG